MRRYYEILHTLGVWLLLSLVTSIPAIAAINVQNTKQKRRQTSLACTNCRAKHAGCDERRPCMRCTKLGIESTCVDAKRKEKKKITQRLLIAILVHKIISLNDLNIITNLIINLAFLIQKQSLFLKRKSRPNPSRFSQKTFLKNLGLRMKKIQKTCLISLLKSPKP